MRAERTKIKDCRIEMGNDYLYIRDGIIIDNSGNQIIRLLSNLCRHKDKNDGQSVLPEFLRRLEKQKVTIESVFLHAASEVRNIGGNTVSSACLEFGRGHDAMGSIGELYSIRHVCSRDMKKKIYGIMQEKITRKTYFFAYRHYQSHVNAWLAAELEECDTAQKFRKLLRGFDGKLRQFYIAENTAKWEKLEKQIIRKLLRMERKK